MRYVDISPWERLYEDGMLQNMVSGHGVVLHSYRKPRNVGMYYYLVTFRGIKKNYKVSTLVVNCFGVKLNCNRQWYEDFCKRVDILNERARKRAAKELRVKDRERKKVSRGEERRINHKLTAIQDLFEGRMSRQDAEIILGPEFISVMLDGKETKTKIVDPIGDIQTDDGYNYTADFNTGF